MGRSGRGGRGFGRGGRGKGGQNKKNGDPNSKKKDATDKKYIFTLIESTVDVRVSAYETTLKKLYEHLMKEIKNHPEDVVDSLKDKKVKDLDNGQSQTIELLPKDADERKIEEIRMINETHKMVYLQIKQKERRRTEILVQTSGLHIASFLPTSVTGNCKIAWNIEMILTQKLRIIPLNCWLLSRK